MMHAALICAWSLLLKFSISSSLYSCRGPGGRGPWPNPNSNSVSLTVLHLHFLHDWVCLQYPCLMFCFNLGSLLSTDSLFIFISRQLCGKCPVMDSCWTGGHKLPVMQWYLTGTLPSICTQHSFLIVSLLFTPQGPPGGGGPPGTPIMPSPGGELYTSVPRLISTFILRSLNRGSF